MISNILHNFKIRNKVILLLSPHYDDVAFSIGGLISLLMKKHNLTNLVVFGKTTYLKYTDKNNIHSCQQIRNKEDVTFTKNINGNRIVLNFSDASVTGHTEKSELLVQPYKHDITKIKAILKQIILKINPDIILSPLGIGGQIDHRAVFLAIQELEKNIGQKILYYEDLPYASSIPFPKLKRIVNTKLGRQAFYDEVDVSNQIVQKKQFLSIYNSQIDKNTSKLIIDHGKKINKFYERIWF